MPVATEVQITFDRERVAQLGLSVRMAADLLETAIKGKAASRFRSEGEEYEIVVRLDEDDRKSMADINELQFISPTGTRAQLNDFAHVAYGSGPTRVYRENQTRAAAVVCNIAEGVDLDTAIGNIKNALADLPLPAGYFLVYGGDYQRMQETFVDLGFAAGLAVLLVFMIMAAQFESLTLPFAIILSVPFAFVGRPVGLLRDRNDALGHLGHRHHPLGRDRGQQRHRAD